MQIMWSCYLWNDNCNAKITDDSTAKTVIWRRVILIWFGNVERRKEGLERKREELNIIVLLLVDNYILYFCLSRAQVDSCRFWSVQWVGYELFRPGWTLFLPIRRASIPTESISKLPSDMRFLPTRWKMLIIQWVPFVLQSGFSAMLSTILSFLILRKT